MKADEAMGSSAADRRAERKRRAVIGPLPDSFLRIPGAETVEADKGEFIDDILVDRGDGFLIFVDRDHDDNADDKANKKSKEH